MSTGRVGPILLVEDNPDDVELTLRAFAQHGIANPIVVAGDGVQALEYLLPANGPGYVRKPVGFADFTEAVRQLGLYWLVINNPPPSRGE